jgi:integrase
MAHKKYFGRYMSQSDLDGFIEYLYTEDRAAVTVSNYIRNVKFFFYSYDKVTAGSIIAWKQDMLAKGYAPSSINIRLGSILAYAKFKGLHLPKIKKLKLPRPTAENVISAQEFDTLCDRLKADNDMRCYWLVQFLAKTGARVGEFVRLDKQALKRGHAEMHSKGKIRRIYLPAPLVEASKNYFAEQTNNLLFPSYGGGAFSPKRKGRQMTNAGMFKILQTLGKKYGIRKEVMHPHGFRHFFAKEFLKKGGDLALLSDLLGHSSLAMTAIYTRKTSEEMAEGLSRIMMPGAL